MSELESLNLFITFTCISQYETCAADVALHTFWSLEKSNNYSLLPFEAARPMDKVACFIFSRLCPWNLTIDEQCQHGDLFCLPLSVPGDSSAPWIPWLSHREAAEWTANGTTPVHCPSDPHPSWCFLSAYEQTIVVLSRQRLNPSADWIFESYRCFLTVWSRHLCFLFTKLENGFWTGLHCVSTTYRSNYCLWICNVMVLCNRFYLAQ